MRIHFETPFFSYSGPNTEKFLLHVIYLQIYEHGHFEAGLVQSWAWGQHHAKLLEMG